MPDSILGRTFARNARWIDSSEKRQHRLQRCGIRTWLATKKATIGNMLPLHSINFAMIESATARDGGKSKLPAQRRRRDIFVESHTKNSPAPSGRHIPFFAGRFRSYGALAVLDCPATEMPALRASEQTRRPTRPFHR